MTLRTLATVERYRARSEIEVEVRFTGCAIEEMERRYASSMRNLPPIFTPQCAGDLGERLSGAASSALSAGAAKVVLIGTDCPGISEDILAAAFASLEDDDLVLGPATDGGYYLLGLRQMAPQLFVGIPWSTDAVLRDTLDIARSLHLRVHLLPALPDIDRPEDLIQLIP